MIRGNMLLDGSSVGATLTWKLDRTVDPMHLDIVMAKKSGKSKILPMIVRFLDEHRLQARMSEDMTSRPPSFSESVDRNQIVLERQ
jgi:hypothetical protein